MVKPVEYILENKKQELQASWAKCPGVRISPPKINSHKCIQHIQQLHQYVKEPVGLLRHQISKRKFRAQTSGAHSLLIVMIKT